VSSDPVSTVTGSASHPPSMIVEGTHFRTHSTLTRTRGRLWDRRIDWHGRKSPSHDQSRPTSSPCSRTVCTSRPSPCPAKTRWPARRSVEWPVIQSWQSLWQCRSCTSGTCPCPGQSMPHGRRSPLRVSPVRAPPRVWRTSGTRACRTSRDNSPRLVRIDLWLVPAFCRRIA
jgi:hypothetical protein